MSFLASGGLTLRELTDASMRESIRDVCRGFLVLVYSYADLRIISLMLVSVLLRLVRKRLRRETWPFLCLKFGGLKHSIEL